MFLLFALPNNQEEHQSNAKMRVRLCAACMQAILRRDRQSDRREDKSAHHGSLAALLEAVDEGCHFCTEFMRLLSEQQLEALTERSAEWMSLTNGRVSPLTWVVIGTGRLKNFAKVACPTGSVRCYILFASRINDQLREIYQNTHCGLSDPNLFMELLPVDSK